MNSSRIHHFFVTETRNRKPNNRGIHNRNRNFKNRARILISGQHGMSATLMDVFALAKWVYLENGVLQNVKFGDSSKRSRSNEQ